MLTAGAIRATFARRFGEMYGPARALGEPDAGVLAGARAGYAIGSRFYGFQYAVGALVALALLEQGQRDPGEFGERCVALLGRARSEAPADQLARVGLDLGAATWEAGLDGSRRRISAIGGAKPAGGKAA